MASLTAIELGADTCAFARTTVRGDEVHLSAAEILDPAAFPGTDAFTVGVRQIRRSLRLPRRCRVVLWGLPEGANRKDAAVKPLLAPLTNAGFKVDRVVSPCNALAALGRLKTSRFEGSTCWLAINRGGVAIVVVRPGKLLYAHSFAWDSTIGASGSQARLLQRYSLVSFLSPEVKRAMAEARKSGTPVYAVVTCGNIPDLRSLTMPLIEELDVEVETLDSFEGLVVKPPVAEKLAESASAIRMACAAAIARGTRPWDPSKKRTGPIAVARYARAAVFAAVIAGVGYAWYVRFAPASSPAPVVIVPAKSTTPPPRAQIQTPIVPSNRAPQAAAVTAPPVVSVPAPATKTPAPVVTAFKTPPVTAPAPKANPPVVTATKPPVVSAPPAVAAKGTPPPVVTTPKTPPVTAPAPKAAPSVVTATKPPVVSAPPAAAKSTPPPVVTTPKTPPVTAPAPKAAPSVVTATKPPVVSAPPAAAKSTPPPVVTTPKTPPVTVPAPKAAPSVVTATKPPVVSALPAAASAQSASLPPKGGNYRDGTGTSPPAMSVPAKKPESNPPALKSTTPSIVTPSRTPAATEANTVPGAPLLPLVTLPRPNLPAQSAARTAPPAAAAPARQAGPTPDTRTPALNTPTIPTDKPEAAWRGPMPALLKDAVPRVTAILVSRDRRFATVDGGQIIGIGDLLGRRTVVSMDDRSVLLQEPSGVQIRIGLGGRLLGVERAQR